MALVPDSTNSEINIRSELKLVLLILMLNEVKWFSMAACANLYNEYLYSLIIFIMWVQWMKDRYFLAWLRYTEIHNIMHSHEF